PGVERGPEPGVERGPEPDIDGSRNSGEPSIESSSESIADRAGHLSSQCSSQPCTDRGNELARLAGEQRVIPVQRTRMNSASARTRLSLCCLMIGIDELIPLCVMREL